MSIETTLRWFLPDPLTSSQQQRAARRVIVFALAVAFWGPVFSPIFYVLGSPRGAAVILLTVVLLLLTILSMRVTRAVFVSGQLVAGILGGALFALAMLTGGIGAPALWWLPTVPIIGLLLGGVGSGFVWLLLTCLTCLLFMGMDRMGIGIRDEITGEAMQFLNIASHIGIILCTFSLTLAFKLSEDHAQAELEAARLESERANQVKSDFLANISHEIRTPMNAIIGMTDLVRDTELNETQQTYLGLVSDSAESLLILINEILDFSKVEAGKLELETIDFDLREELGDALKSLALRAHAKGLELAWDVAPDVPQRLQGDPFRLRQMLINLVGNGIKFTEAGEVTVEVQRQGGEADKIVLRIAVHDSGPGIPADKQAEIFSAFHQADTSTTREFGGTGLGLAITERIATAMDGRVWVESELGRGSTFNLELPFHCEQDVGESPSEILQGVEVMVVDDNAMNRGLLQRLLRRWGASVETAAGGEAAKRLLQQRLDQGKPPPVLVLDACMPEGDGFELCKWLQEKPQLRGTPVLMLLTSGLIEDAKRCEHLGVCKQLIKPVKPSELRLAFEEIFALEAMADRASDRQAADPQGKVPSLQVLLAEDGKTNQLLAVALLNQWGHKVTVANNGQEAVERWRAAAFDLILMDVQMPVLDGLEATRQIREEEGDRGQHIPIVAMTARSMSGDRELCLAAGMDDYVSKPVRREELYAALQQIWEAAGNSRQRAAAENDGRRGNAEQPVIDWEAALRTVEGHAALLDELIEAAVLEMPDLLRRLTTALDRQDALRVETIAHSLKGSAAVIAAVQVREAAAAVEQAAALADLETARRLTTRLQEAVETLRQASVESKDSP